MVNIERLTKVRNRLVYLLIIIAAALATLSIASYAFNFSYLIWIALIALFFGVLGLILKISNMIFDINNPDYKENTEKNAEVE